MNVKQLTIWNNLKTNCCFENTVTCNGNIIQLIDWNSKMLDGYINGSAIPSTLLYLNLYSNEIIGSIPNPLPSSLTELYLFGNKMSGDIPPLPPGMTKFQIGYPGYSGNHFTGSIIIDSPIFLTINDNWITDVIVQNTGSLVICDLSKNPLLNNPRISLLPMCTKNGLYSASLLPNTLSTVSTAKSATSFLSSSFTGITSSTELSAMSADIKPIRISTTHIVALVASTWISSSYSTFPNSIETETTIGTKSTIAFAIIAVPFKFHWWMFLKLFCNFLMLGAVFLRAPFKRGIPKFRSKIVARSLMEF